MSAPTTACTDGAEHLEHIWPVEPFVHAPEAECICAPEFLSDDSGFYWLHHRVAPVKG